VEIFDPLLGGEDLHPIHSVELNSSPLKVEGKETTVPAYGWCLFGFGLFPVFPPPPSPFFFFGGSLLSWVI